jgi:hypothetical protein
MKSEQQLIIFELIVNRTVWCDLLSKVNFSSHILQSLTVHKDLATVHQNVQASTHQKYNQ